MAGKKTSSVDWRDRFSQARWTGAIFFTKRNERERTVIAASACTADARGRGLWGAPPPPRRRCGGDRRRHNGGTTTFLGPAKKHFLQILFWRFLPGGVAGAASGGGRGGGATGAPSILNQNSCKRPCLHFLKGLVTQNLLRTSVWNSPPRSQLPALPRGT